MEKVRIIVIKIQYNKKKNILNLKFLNIYLDMAF